VVDAVGPEIVARPIRKVQVKGRKHEFMIYELLGIRTSDDPELRAADDAGRLCEMTKIASSHFERGEFDKAARRYREILQAFPQDPVATSLLAMCQAEAPA
jgi:adenylate cyclase